MYPIMMNLSNKPVVVIGGGRVAARKIAGLLQAGANVTVVSTSLLEGIDSEKICWKKKKYEAADIKGAALIFACTDDEAVNEQVLADADESQWVNVTSNKRVAEFYNMATTQVNDLSVSVSTSGVSPMRAKKVRKLLADYLTKLEI